MNSEQNKINNSIKYKLIDRLQELSSQIDYLTAGHLFKYKDNISHAEYDSVRESISVIETFLKD